MPSTDQAPWLIPVIPVTQETNWKDHSLRPVRGTNLGRPSQTLTWVWWSTFFNPSYAGGDMSVGESQSKAGPGQKCETIQKIAKAKS
jgi:hypothetical protein